MDSWNKQVKMLLKAELVKRGISVEELVLILNSMGIAETKASVNSKLSRGTFSAVFLLQCLNAIGCKQFETNIPFIIKENNNGNS